MNMEICRCAYCDDAVVDVQQASFIWFEERNFANELEFNRFGTVHDACLIPIKHEHYTPEVKLRALPLDYALHPQIIKTFSTLCKNFVRYQQEFSEMVRLYGSEDESDDSYID